ncbi:MAG: hypothetical protein AAGA96_08920 [Verrucomicrobiota bacterium]
MFHFVLVLGVTSFSLSEDGDFDEKTYSVPPTFGLGFDGEKWHDPFTDPPPMPRASAKEFLQELGIVFKNGATATYEPESSTLTVRNTEDQLELVEAYLDSVLKGIESSGSSSDHSNCAGEVRGRF